MINWINSWIKGIVIAVIISTIIEMILPNGNIKKYIKTVIGVYIIFTIVSPVITKITGKEIDIAKYVNAQTEKYQAKEIATIDTNYYIKQTYIENIKKDITREMETMGYKVNNLNIEIEEKEEEYGIIKKMQLEISNKTSNVKPIEISVNKSQENKKSEIATEEIENIKSFLKNTYGVEAENIIIN